MVALKNAHRVSLRLLLAMLVWVLMVAGPAASEVRLLKGQTIYVPAYSHIYHGDREQPFYLAVTLSVRNTDPVQTLHLVSVDYYDTDGKLLKRYIDREIPVTPMASAEFVVRESDRAGGVGANFVVTWKAQEKMNEPIAESIMIGTLSQQGISFTSRGRAIREE